MSKKEQIQLFENRNVRTLWDEQEEEWYFSIVDVVAILTDQQDSKKASTYWSVLKGRLRKEGADEPLTKCKKLKMLSADGKSHPTDAATAETLKDLIYDKFTNNLLQFAFTPTPRPLADIKPRTTRFPRIQITMAHYQRLRITLMQVPQQFLQCPFLSLSASILWSLAVGGQSADIAYANGVAIMVLAVGALLFLGSSLFNRPVGRNDIVVSTSLPSEGTMIAVDIRHSQCAALLIGRAMHDNQCNLPHKNHFF